MKEGARAHSAQPISVTATLAILFALVAAGIFAVTNAFVFFFVEQQWRRGAQQDLEVGANALRVLIASQPGEKAFAAKGAAISEDLSRLRRLTFSVVNTSGKVLLSTLPEVFPEAAFERAANLENPRDWSWDERHFSVAEVPGHFGDGSAARLRLALDVTEPRGIQAAYSRALLLITLGGGIIAAILGVAVARKGLAPLHRMAHAASEITASRLGERLRPEDTPTELRELASNFNGMLGRLEESFQRLHEFSSDLAHELRTPINNLLGQTQVALSRERESAEYRAVLESNAEELEHLSHMIQDMLFLARADNARAALSLEHVALAEECAKLADYFEPLADDNELRIEVSGEATVNADRLLVRRALANLISNAIRHSPAGSAVGVVIEAFAEGEARVTVSNPGPGISASDLPRVFDRFYRAGAAGTRDAEGTGLGLAIVRSIARLHGGEVSAQCEPGVETRFVITLPRDGPKTSGNPG